MAALSQLLWDAITNKILISTLFAWLIAQGLKVIIDAVKNGFSSERLTGGGGFPSAHSATVAGLFVSTLISEGAKSFGAVMALFFAIMIIYDAAGVRFETGREAKALNELNRREIEAGREPIIDGKKPLKEKMGHTKLEIAAGIFIGIAVADLVCLCFFK